jgi:hypothetical protein
MVVTRGKGGSRVVVGFGSSSTTTNMYSSTSVSFGIYVLAKHPLNDSV